MNSVAIAPKATYVIEVTKGPSRGTIFELRSARTTIGRADGNNIVLNDPKCSRTHLIIEIHSNGVSIKDVSSKNTMLLNGQEAKQGVLGSKDIIQIGDSELRFTSIASQAVVSHSAPAEPLQMVKPKKQRRSSRPANSNSFYIVAGFIALIFFWLLSTGTKNKNNMWKLRTSSDINAEIEVSKQNADNRETMLKNKGKNTRQYLDAQSAFIRGFRDYQNGQFVLAQRAFREALAIFPSHELAERYRLLSEQRIKEFIQNHMMEGRKYLDRQNYNLCVSAYKKVLDIIADPQNSTYKEAEQRWRECSLLQMGRF